MLFLKLNKYKNHDKNGIFKKMLLFLMIKDKINNLKNISIIFFNLLYEYWF